jgi:hypothetical protein
MSTKLLFLSCIGFGYFLILFYFVRVKNGTRPSHQNVNIYSDETFCSRTNLGQNGLRNKLKLNFEQRGQVSWNHWSILKGNFFFFSKIDFEF